MKKRILSIVLTLCMVLMFMPQTVFAEDGVPYLDETGAVQTCPDATAVTESDTEWTEGWYVAQGTVEINSRVAVSGDVHLILADGCTLTVNGGIQVQDNSTNDTPNTNALTIYAQSTAENMGKLIAEADFEAGIGGNNSGMGTAGSGGIITINGGNVTATSFHGAGIGGGYGATAGSGGNVTINGGKVNTASTYGAGIGGGYGEGAYGGSGGTVTITGGTVNATGTYGTGIGGGSGYGRGGSGGTVTITGGNITATSTKTANIGGAYGNSGGTLIITGGVINDLGSNGLPNGYNGNDYIIPGEGNSFQVSGAVTLPVDLTIPEGKTLTLPEGACLTVPEGVTLTIAEGATLENNGTINNSGNIYVNGTFNGTADNLYYPLTLVNASAAGDISVYNTKTYGKAGGEITLTSGTQTGYSFDKWEVSPVSVTIGADNKFTMPSAALTATAKWTTNQYTITFNTDGGSEIAPVMQDYGTEITAPENPTKTGYIFAGWDQSIPDKMPAEDMKITAKWTVCDHSGSTAQPTCKYSAICTVCGGTIAALSHSLEEVASNSATCTEDGNIKYYRCSDCGDLFADENAETVITLEDTVIPATGHSYKDGKCVNCGSDDPATIGGPDEYECNCIFCSILRWIKAFVRSCVIWIQNTPVSIGKWLVGVFNNIIALVK